MLRNAGIAKRIISELRVGRERCKDRSTGMSDTTERTFAAFFTDIGLMRVGLERPGWRIAFRSRECDYRLNQK